MGDRAGRDARTSPPISVTADVVIRPIDRSISLLGPNCSSRGRTEVFRKCETGPDAPYQDVGICFTDGKVGDECLRILDQHLLHVHIAAFAVVFKLRSKQLNQPSSAIPPQKAASLQGQSGKEEGSHKEGSGNSSPRSEDSPLPGTGENRLSIGSLSGLANGAGPNMTSSASAGGPVSGLAAAAGANANARPQTWPGVPNGAVLPAALGKPPPGRDAKGRARSRDFLKQCLQEVNYLTSSAALNPLPNRPILTAAVATQAPQQPLQHAQALLAAQQQQGGGSTLASGTGMPLSLPNLPSFDQQQQQQAGFGTSANGASGLNSTLSGFNGRPRKVVPEVGKDFPTLNGIGSAGPNISVPQGAAGGQNASLVSEPPNIPPPNPALLNADRDKDRAGGRAGSPNSAILQPLATEGAEPGLSLERQFSKQTDDQGNTSTGESESNQITAIFRPDAAGEWKERLRAAAEAVERAKGG